MSICPQCYDLSGIENEINDGHTTIADRRSTIDDLIADVESKGGDVADWKNTFRADTEVLVLPPTVPSVGIKGYTVDERAAILSHVVAKKTVEVVKHTHVVTRERNGRIRDAKVTEWDVLVDGGQYVGSYPTKRAAVAAAARVNEPVRDEDDATDGL